MKISLISFILLVVLFSWSSRKALCWDGATLGSVYYAITKKSFMLGFLAGVCPTIGVSGHISGGGFGMLLRKYGLAADHVMDARIVDVKGIILNRKSMGDDLFWAIGGVASFGIITAWKVQLVDVPEKVTIFTIKKTLEQNATQLIHSWKYVAPGLDKDLFIRIMTILAAKITLLLLIGEY